MAFSHINLIRSWTVIIFVTIAPLHAFLVTWSGAQFLAPWREVLVGLLLIAVAVERILLRKRLIFDLLDWVILAFSGYALLFALFGSGSISQRVLGFRFDVMPWILFLGVRHVSWEKPERYFKAALVSACGVMMFGIMQSVILPVDFLTHFGYSVEQASFTPDRPITGCQYLEHTASVCRAIATFGGPTRFGTYLLLVLGLMLPRIAARRGASPWRANILIALLVIITIVLTYSRSIWIGALVMCAIIFISWARSRFGSVKHRVLALCLVVVLAALVGVGAYQSESGFGKIVLLRSTSTSEHREFFLKGIEKLRENPLGLGLGTVGPASVRFEKFLTENWYLQIALEMGIVGLALFLILLTILVKKLWSMKENSHAFGLALGIIGVASAGLFTHSFEETSTMLILTALAGISLSKRQSS